MTAEQYWMEHREEFLAEARQTQGYNQLLETYRQLMERMKSSVMASFAQEDVLRQQIALLFQQNIHSAALILSYGEPYTVHNSGDTASDVSKWQPLLKPLSHPLVLPACLAAGLVFSLLAGNGAWRCALFFAAALACTGAAGFSAAGKKSPAQAKSDLRLDYLDTFILNSARKIDAHVRDLQALLLDIVVPTNDTALDANAQLLCQQMWSVANINYPAQGALFTAEKLLRQNDMEWVEYSPEWNHWFEVMPTKKASRTVYPALRKISDGSLVCKGQYVQSQNDTGKDGAK